MMHAACLVPLALRLGPASNGLQLEPREDDQVPRVVAQAYPAHCGEKKDRILLPH